MKKRLIIHIGSPKTGTTAIQTFLSQNQNLLRQSGLNYVRAGRTHISHNGMVDQFRNGQAAHLCQEIAEEISDTDTPVHVISSELFFRPAVARFMAAGFTEHLSKDILKTVSIPCYLRRHDQYMEALYKQLVKTGKAESDPIEFMKVRLKRITYSFSLGSYERAFGSTAMVVRPFNRKAFKNGDVVDDFMNLCGVDIPEGAVRNDPGTTNKTFSAELTELIGVVGKNPQINVRRLVRDLTELQQDTTFRTNDVYDRDTRRGILAYFVDELETLRKNNCPEKETFFDMSDLAEGADTSTDSDPRSSWRNASLAILEAVSRQLLPDHAATDPSEVLSTEDA